jgi:hypothetical protein
VNLAAVAAGEKNFGHLILRVNALGRKRPATGIAFPGRPYQRDLPMIAIRDARNSVADPWRGFSCEVTASFRSGALIVSGPPSQALFDAPFPRRAWLPPGRR